MDFTYKWEREEKLLNLCGGKNTILDKPFEERLSKLNCFARVFGITIEKAKETIPYWSYILTCEEDELIEKYQFYKKIFGEHLLDVINNDHINMPKFYNGIFSYKNKRLIEKKVEGLKSFFNLDINGVVRLLAYSSYYLYMSGDEIKKSVFFIQDFLDLSCEKVKELFIMYPRIISVPFRFLGNRVEKLSEYFECGIEEIKKMYRIFPLALMYTGSLINDVFRFYLDDNRQKNQLLKYPWVIACISNKKGHEYCGLDSMTQLLTIAELITKIFGEIIYVRKRDWNAKKRDITYLLTKTRTEKYCLICLGAERSLERIFNDYLSSNRKYYSMSFQYVPKEDIDNLEEYFLRAGVCFDKGLKGYERKGGEGFIEIPLKKIEEDFDIEIYLDNDENITVEIFYIMQLEKIHFELLKNYHKNKYENRKKHIDRIPHEDFFSIINEEEVDAETVVFEDSDEDLISELGYDNMFDDEDDEIYTKILDDMDLVGDDFDDLDIEEDIVNEEKDDIDENIGEVCVKVENPFEISNDFAGHDHFDEFIEYVFGNKKLFIEYYKKQKWGG